MKRIQPTMTVTVELATGKTVAEVKQLLERGYRLGGGRFGRLNLGTIARAPRVTSFRDDLARAAKAGRAKARKR